MKFNNQSTFNGHQITNVVDRPILHKKGKRWITIGLSTLLLAGLGTVATTNNIHASSFQNLQNGNNNNELSNKSNLNINTKAIGNQASTLHNQIVKYNNQQNINTANYQHSKLGLSKLAMTPRVINPTSASNDISSTSTTSNNSKTSISQGNASESSSNNTMNTLQLGNKLEQARRWNFVQYGLNNSDYDSNGSSNASYTSYKATSNQSNPSTSSASNVNNITLNSQSTSNSNRKTSNSASVQPSFNASYQNDETQTGNINSEDYNDNSNSNNNNLNTSATNNRPRKALLQDAKQSVTTDIIFDTNRNGMYVRVGSDKVQASDGKVDNVSDINKIFTNTGLGTNYALSNPLQIIKSNQDVSNSPSVTLNGGYIRIGVKDTNPQASDISDDIPVYGDKVNLTGNIILNFPNSSDTNATHTITIPYNINTLVNSTLTNILPNATVPTDYLNKIIKQFNTKNFTYTSNPKSTMYDNYYVASPNSVNSDVQIINNDNNSYTYKNPDITLNFTPNSMNETIHYQYNGKNISNNPKDANGVQETNDKNTTIVSGANDSQGNLASDNVPAGWHLATDSNGEPSANNSWIYGNGGSDASGIYSDNHNVNVMPNQVKTTIQYQVSDNNATNNGNTINTVTKIGNDYRAIDAGNNTFNANTLSDVPAGYHIISGQKTNIPYDNNVNGNHIIKVIGNERNASDKDTNPQKISTTNPSTLPKTDPNYIPASDVVAIHSVEYVAGNNKPVGTITKYIAISGKTGEQNTYDPNDYQPAGYSTDSNDKSQSVTIQPNGVSPNSVTFAYNAQTEDNITVAIQYEDNKGVEHTLARHDITGPTSQQGNIYTYKDSKNNNSEDLAFPKGYHFISAFGGAQGQTPEPNTINGSNFPYTVTANAQDIIINVAGNPVVPKQSVTPTKPTVPSDNPNTPTDPSDVPSNKLNTPVNILDKNNTFYVTIRDWDGQHLVRTYQKRITEAGHIGDQFNVNPNTYITNGYSKTNSDMTYNGYIGADSNGNPILLASDFNTPNNNVTWNYKANSQSASITYKDQAGNTKTVTINGHTDSDINVTKSSDGGSNLPNGYHIIPNTNYDYKFNSPTNNPNHNPQQTYNIEGNSVTGKIYVHTLYNEMSDNNTSQKVQTDIDKMPTITLDGHIGDKITINPTTYEKNNYDDNNTLITVPMDWNSVSQYHGIQNNNGNINNYNPTYTFNYNAPAGEADITYIDVDHDQNNNSTGTIENHNTVNYQGHTYPIVGHQVIKYIGTIGSTINLTTNGVETTNGTIINSKASDKLQAPNGFYFVNNTSNNRILSHITNTANTMIHLTNFGGTRRLMLFLSRPNISPNHHKNKPNSNRSNPSSKANITPTSSKSKPSHINVSSSSTTLPIVPSDFRSTESINNNKHYHNTTIRPTPTFKPRNKKGNKHKEIKDNHYYVYSPTNITLYGKHTSIKINKNRGFTGKILKTVKFHGVHILVIKWRHKIYVIDAKQARNAYIQPKEFKRHAHGIIQHTVIKLRKDARIYNSVHFTLKHLYGNIKAGSTLTVVGIKPFGEKGYQRTRLMLSNGLIITANKNFVKII